MKHLTTIAKVIVSICLLIWLFYQIDWQQIWHVFSHFKTVYLFTLFLLAIIGILLSVWKWSHLLKNLGHSLSFTYLLKIFWIGLFFNNFLPGRTGGDLYRAYGISQKTNNKMQATISVIIDRILNIVALSTIGLLGYWLSDSKLTLEPNSLHLIFGIGIGLILSLLTIYKLRHNPYFVVIKQSLGLFLRHPSKLFFPLLLALVYQTIMILSHIVVFEGLGQQTELPYFFCFIPLTAFATLLPISINGIGIREGAFVISFAQIGVASEYALALSLIITMTTMFVSALGGVFYAISRTPSTFQHVQNSPSPTPEEAKSSFA